MAADATFDLTLPVLGRFDRTLDPLGWFDEDLIANTPTVQGVRLGVYDPELEPQTLFNVSIDPLAWFDDDLVPGIVVTPGTVVIAASFGVAVGTFAGQMVLSGPAVSQPSEGGGLAPLTLVTRYRRRVPITILAARLEGPAPNWHVRLEVEPSPLPEPPIVQPGPATEPLEPVVAGLGGAEAPEPLPEAPAPLYIAPRRLDSARFGAPAPRWQARLAHDGGAALRRRRQQAFREDLELVVLMTGDPTWMLAEDLEEVAG